MDRASSLIFPGSKTLAGWWRQLQPCQPQSLWIGYAFVHRVEAPVNILRSQAVEPLTHLLLQALALERGNRDVLAGLQARLGLPAAVLHRVLLGMETDRFLVRGDGDDWQLSELGAEALRTRHFPRHTQERRVFPFVESLDAAGQRVAPPGYLPLCECVATPWQVDDAHRFDIACLRSAIEQAREAGGGNSFPGDVQSLVNSEATEPWQQVIVDRPERVLFVHLLANAAGLPEWLGFAVKIDGWTLHDQTPALRLPAGSVWPELAAQTSNETWQEAWRSWCRQRQLPMNEVEACAIAYRAPRLEVQAPPRLLQRLQAAKSDLFKGDAWVLVGDGFIRQAAQLSVS